jgi:fibronectin-binding autotransporter adhesin
MRHNESQIWSWRKPHIRRSRNREVVRRSRFVKPELLEMEGRTLLSTFTVTSTADDLGRGTLRWAIDQANRDDQANTIDFSPTVFATPHTITLNFGQLLLRDTAGTQTIVGPAAGLTISANHESRVFEIDTNVTAVLSDLTVTAGRADGGGGVQDLPGSHITMTDCTLASNHANTGNIISYQLGGGGLRNDHGTVTLTNCTIADNDGQSVGGGLSSFGGTMTLTNCTVTSNVAQYGGGLYTVEGKLILTNCTVAANRVKAFAGRPGGGGIDTYGQSLVLTNTIVAGNASAAKPDDINVNSGSVSGSYDLIGTGGSGGLKNGVDHNIVGAPDPGLAPLGNYGGPTRTMALLSGSPALGAGTSGPGLPTTDQRGFPLASPPDIGAFQKTLVVDSTSGAVGTLAGNLTLRGAVQLANVIPGPNVITFDPATFASPQTITLTNGPLVLANTTGTTTISGPTAGVTISGGGMNRDFEVASGVSATINNLSITGGSTAENGGGVLNYGDLSIDDSTLFSNKAGGLGGAIFTSGGSLDATNCTIASNTAGISGGGIDAQGSVTVKSSTFTGNVASSGGGDIDDYSGRYTVTLEDSLLAGDSAPFGPEFSNSVVSLGHNLVATTNGSNGWVSTDLTGTTAHPLVAGLGTLGQYGGPTQTVPLLPGSPAIDAGTSGAGIATSDQRGEPRTGVVDIGAFQSQGFTLTMVPGSSPQQTTIGTPFAHQLTVTVTANNPIEPVAGGTVTFTAPTTGASAVLGPASTAPIGATGLAGVIAVANTIAGSYVVNAAVAGADTPVAFNLTNTASASAQAALQPSNARPAQVSANAVDQVLGDLSGLSPALPDVHAMALDHLNARTHSLRQASMRNSS